MDKLIARLNIEHYRKVLASERDRDKRALISRLLAKEETTLAALERPASRAAATAAAVTANEGVSYLNLDYYRKRLETETSPVLRGILVRLIKEEEERIAPPEARKTGGGD